MIKHLRDINWRGIRFTFFFALQSRSDINLNQSLHDAPWSLAFSRATGRLHAFTSSCHWLPLIISFTLIGRCDYFGFGFRHSIEKRSIWLTLIERGWCACTNDVIQNGAKNGDEQQQKTCWEGHFLLSITRFPRLEVSGM